MMLLNNYKNGLIGQWQFTTVTSSTEHPLQRLHLWDAETAVNVGVLLLFRLIRHTIVGVLL